MTSSQNLRNRPKQQSPQQKTRIHVAADQLVKQSPKTAHKQPQQKINHFVRSQKIVSVASTATITSNQCLNNCVNANIVQAEYYHAQVNSCSMLYSANNIVFQSKKKSANYTDDFEIGSAGIGRQENGERSGQGSGEKIEDVPDSLVLQDSILAKLPSCYKNYHSVFEEISQKKQYRSVKCGMLLEYLIVNFRHNCKRKW